MARLLLIQMSGAPGAGKSTVAQAIGRRTGAAVLDHDVTKSALLDVGVDPALAGRASYAAVLALARSLLEGGVGVVLDSPCYYPELLAAGLRLATETGACYRYLECVVDDLTELARRLRERPRLPSQVRDLAAASVRAADGATLTGEALFREWIAHMQRPPHSSLRLDTARPLAECLDAALAFIAECRVDAEPGVATARPIAAP